MDMSQIDPRMLQQILALGEQDPQQASLKRQQAMADQMRGNAMQPQQGRMIGKVYVPGTNLATAAGDLYQGYQASKMQPGIDQGMQDVTNRRTSARGSYLQKLIEAMRRGGEAQPPQASGFGDQEGMDGPFSTPQAGY